jgi:hypothetical protein
VKEEPCTYFQKRYISPRDTVKENPEKLLYNTFIPGSFSNRVIKGKQLTSPRRIFLKIYSGKKTCY